MCGVWPASVRAGESAPGPGRVLGLSSSFPKTELMARSPSGPTLPSTLGVGQAHALLPSEISPDLSNPQDPSALVWPPGCCCCFPGPPCSTREPQATGWSHAASSECSVVTCLQHCTP